MQVSFKIKEREPCLDNFELNVEQIVTDGQTGRQTYRHLILSDLITRLFTFLGSAGIRNVSVLASCLTL